MSHRFFLDPQTPDSIKVGTELLLDGDQAHHAIHVMRFQTGDELVLFDGRGMEFGSRVVSIAKKKLSVEVVSVTKLNRSVSTEITIAVALPKGDRQKFLIEKLVELGVAHLIPLKTSRSVAVPNEKVTERLRKQVIEASKQCGRNHLMTIAEGKDLRQLGVCLDARLELSTGSHSESTTEPKLESRSAVELDDQPASDKDSKADSETDSKTSEPERVLGSECKRFIADPYQGESIAAVASKIFSSVVIAIGPEGGFDDKENDLARELGFAPLTLGPSILRVETAALAAAAIFGIGRNT
ncbi:MAG: 16S rRNA (uracil(1498)-N(3))-methyltransferase [Mariniblastus sp.]